MQSLWNRNFKLISVSNFLMSFSFNIFGATLPLHLTQDLGAGRDSTGLVLSAYVAASLLMRPFSGFLVDTFPRKRLYIIAFFLFTCFSASYFFASTVNLFATFRFLHGFVWGLISTAGSTLAIDLVCSERRGEAIGYYGVSSNVSMAIGPMTGLFLFENTSFFVVIAASAASCACGFLIALLINAPPRLPVVKRVISLDRFLLKEGILPGLTMTCVAIAFGMVMSFTALYGAGLHIKNTGIFFVLQAIGFIASRIISGKYLNQHSYNIGAFGAITGAAFVCVLALFPYTAVYFGVAVFLGISFGMNVPAVQNIIVSSAPNCKRGTANSTYLTSFDIGMGIGMLGGGTLAEHFGIPTAFLTGAAFATIGGLWLYSQKRRAMAKYKSQQE